ncbi:type II toxin-antitoxin system VapC family toxin [Geminocystis sp. CENA526]|uniref:type II toxin-antitoxin system VapC family toxin n=1 Tax=Geminocystis sp. CENA526 TaxID=1355871 RepID=UPI003D6F1485
MKILLDTHIFLWLIHKNKLLSKEVIELINNPKNEIFLSVVSIWECVIKYQISKLNFPESPELYLPKKREEYLIESLIIDEGSIKNLIDLPLLHKYPFDRLLISQSLQHNLTFITEDNVILQYPNIKVFNQDNQNI